MTTNIKKALDAFLLINGLGGVRMKSTATSRKLFGLKILLKPAYEFYQEEERKLVEDLGGKITEDSQIVFADQAEGIKNLSAGREELWRSEWEIPIDTPVIFHDSEGLQVSGNDIELLEELGLAKFIE